MTKKKQIDRALGKLSLVLVALALFSFSVSFGFYRASDPANSKGYLATIAGSFGDRVSPKVNVSYDDAIDLTGIDTIEIRTVRTNVTVRVAESTAAISAGGNLAKAHRSVRARLALDPSKAPGTIPFNESREGGRLRMVLTDDVQPSSGVQFDVGDDDDSASGLAIEIPKTFSGTIVLASISGDGKVVGGGWKAVDVTTASGEMFIEKVSATALRTKSVSGDAEIEGVFETIETTSTSGEISIHPGTSTNAILIKTVSGDIAIHFPAKPDLDYRMTTVSGDLLITDAWRVAGGKTANADDDDFETRRSRAGKIGTGTTRLEIKTVSGDVSLE